MANIQAVTYLSGVLELHAASSSRMVARTAFLQRSLFTGMIEDIADEENMRKDGQTWSGFAHLQHTHSSTFRRWKHIHLLDCASP